MEQKLSDTLVKMIDRSNPMMQNLQLASRFNKLIDEGGDADLEDNKEATIDVSAYTEPVEIEPTEGKDGMKKTTVTLSNIPSGGAELTLDYPSWLTEGSEMNSVVPNGVKVSITDYDHTPNTYIITGDGAKTIAELTEQTNFNGFFGTYGQSVVIEVQ